MAMKDSNTIFVGMIKNWLEHLLKPFDLRVESIVLNYQHETNSTCIGVKAWRENNCIFERTFIYDKERIQLPIDEVATRCVIRILKQLVSEEELKEAIADELLPPELLELLARTEECL